MRIAADREVCIGSGNCVYSAPALFDQIDDGLVVLLTGEAGPPDDDAARSAVAHCPSGALRLLDD